MDVVLDANVLYPPFLRNALLRLAQVEVYNPYWTEDILEEVRRNIVKVGVTPDQLNIIFNDTNRAFPAALIARKFYEGDISKMSNDPKDRHILAAAVSLKAQIIVTNNLRDFPKEVCEPLNIQVQSSDEFLLERFNTNPDKVMQSFNTWLTDLKNPPLTLEELLSKLNNTAPNTVVAIKQYVGMA